MAAPHLHAGASPWVSQRARAEQLRDRYPFADQVLTLYLALVEVWTELWEVATAQRPEPAQLSRWAAEQAVPVVLKVTEAAGPPPLATAVSALAEADPEAPLAGWLAGLELTPAERYLARASLCAPLAALAADAGAACAADPSPRGDRRCPRCGGLPQVSYRSAAGERLVSGARHLGCSRCGHSWSYSASACPSCADTQASARTIYAEHREGPIIAGTEAVEEAEAASGSDGPTFAHLRLEACGSCRHYLIDVDLGRDGQAVPEVDELAALPLALYAADQGFTKLSLNLMGL